MTTRLTSILCLFAIAAAAGVAAAPASPEWLRYPSISPDGKTIVFTYKGDLYRVPAAGGTAAPLTLHEAHDFMPVWSHDGKWIAFASDRFGNFDVFVMPAEGGEVAPADVSTPRPSIPTPSAATTSRSCSAPRAWTRAANRQFPTGSQPELYRVPVAGGRVEQVLTTPAEDVKVSRNGQFLIYHDKKGGENVWRKHHTSAIARDIWLYDTKDGHAQEAHDVRRRGPQPGLRRRRPGVLLPQRGERHVQRPEDEPAGRQVPVAHLVQERARSASSAPPTTARCASATTARSTR